MRGQYVHMYIVEGKTFVMPLRSLLILTLSVSTVLAFNTLQTAPGLPTRRDILQSISLSSTILISSSTTPASASVIRSPGKCANGEGEGCDSLAEDNELIKSLQKKSSENREANQKVSDISRCLDNFM